MKTLKNRLKNGLAPCYLVTGDDYYLYEKAVDMIKSAVALQLPDFNMSNFDDENFNVDSVISACEMLPLSDDKRVVILKNITKISENDKNKLEFYLKKPNKSTVLVILDFNNKFTWAEEYCESIDARRMDRSLCQSIIVSDLAKRGKSISGEAVDTLLDYCNGYLSGVMNELEKLAFFDVNEPLITKKTVENVAVKTTEFAVFELTEALGKRDLDKALELLSYMEKEPGTLGLITNHFRRMFFISLCEDMTNAELASLLGVKEYAISKQRVAVKNFSKMQLKKIYSLLEDVDYSIKSGAMLTGTALYYLVFSICYI